MKVCTAKVDAAAHAVVVIHSMISQYFTIMMIPIPNIYAPIYVISIMNTNQLWTLYKTIPL